MVKIYLRDGFKRVEIQFDPDDKYSVDSPIKLAKELMEWLDSRVKEGETRKKIATWGEGEIGDTLKDLTKRVEDIEAESRYNNMRRPFRI